MTSVRRSPLALPESRAYRLLVQLAQAGHRQRGYKIDGLKGVDRPLGAAHRAVRLIEKPRREELTPLGSRIRTRLATEQASREELIDGLAQLPS